MDPARFRPDLTGSGQISSPVINPKPTRRDQKSMRPEPKNPTTSLGQFQATFSSTRIIRSGLGGHKPDPARPVDTPRQGYTINVSTQITFLKAPPMAVGSNPLVFNTCTLLLLPPPTFLSLLFRYFNYFAFLFFIFIFIFYTLKFCALCLGFDACNFRSQPFDCL